MIKDWELQLKITKKQWELLHSFNNPLITEILFWWWARWWKTWWIAEIINITCIQMPWIVWLIWRREWDDLRKTSLLNMQTKELTYSNWSKLFFVPLKTQSTDTEFNWLWWYEITYAFIDEAQEVELKAINIIKSRPTEKIKQYNIVGKIIMWCNPDKWHLYSTFIRPIKEEIQSIRENGAESYIDKIRYDMLLKILK